MVMLHIKLKRRKHTYMLANVLPLHTSLTPGGSIGPFFFFSVSSHVACQIKQELSREQNANKYSALLYTHSPQIGSKQFFSEVGHVAYYIKLKGKTCRTSCKFDLMHTPDRSDIEMSQISIF